MADVAVVVGAAGEIGSACARALSASHDSIVCVDRDSEAAKETAASLEARGTRAVALVADAGAADFARSVVGQAGELGAVRTAVHAIAHEEHAPAADISLASLTRSY